MKYLDFSIQTLFITTAILCAFYGFFFIEALYWILVVQFFLGAWQFIGGIISLIIQDQASAFKRSYVSYAGIYLLSLFVFGYFISSYHFEGIKIVILLYAMLPAWILAIYYYTITWRVVIPNRTRQSSFLPHINF